MPGFLPVRLQDKLYCRKSGLREIIPILRTWKGPSQWEGFFHAVEVNLFRVMIWRVENER